MNPKQFLLIGGIILVLLGVLGYVGLGPTMDVSALGSFFWLDMGENVAHLLFGAVALLAYYFLKDAQLQKWLVVAVGVVALLAAIFGFMNAANPDPNVGITNLENPSDNILHLGVALWAFYAAFMGSKKNA